MEQNDKKQEEKKETTVESQMETTSTKPEVKKVEEKAPEKKPEAKPEPKPEKPKLQTKVPYDKLFGRIDNSFQNYHRIDLSFAPEREHIRKIMQYGPGIFCVFSTKSRNITLKLKAHFHMDTYSLPMKSRVEPIVMGMDRFGIWNHLNYMKVYEKDVEKSLASDMRLQFSVDNDDKYEKFQICFPTMSVMLDLSLETTDPVEFDEPPPCDLVFIGSSVAQDNYSSNHMNICPYLYRKFGINSATLAVSGYHTFTCPELMDYLSKLDVPCVLMDVLHMKSDDYAKQAGRIKHLTPYIIYKSRTNVNETIRNNHLGMKDLVILPGDCMWDSVHINDYGTVFYCDKLLERGLIPGVEIEKEEEEDE